MITHERPQKQAASLLDCARWKALSGYALRGVARDGKNFVMSGTLETDDEVFKAFSKTTYEGFFAYPPDGRRELFGPSLSWQGVQGKPFEIPEGWTLPQPTPAPVPQITSAPIQTRPASKNAAEASATGVAVPTTKIDEPQQPEKPSQVVATSKQEPAPQAAVTASENMARAKGEPFEVEGDQEPAASAPVRPDVEDANAAAKTSPVSMAAAGNLPLAAPSEMAVAPDPSMAMDFLKRLYPDAVVNLLRIPRDGGIPAGIPSGFPVTAPGAGDQLKAFLDDSDRQRLNVYFAGNPTSKLDKKPRKTDVSAVVRLFIDVDPHGDPTGGDAGKFGRDQTEIANRLMDSEWLASNDLPPLSLVWSSGGGVQAYYELARPIVRETGMTDDGWLDLAKTAEAAGRGVIDALKRSDITEFGEVDPVQSCDHIFRLPGSVNHPSAKLKKGKPSKVKKGQRPAMARVMQITGAMYDLDAFPAPQSAPAGSITASKDVSGWRMGYSAAGCLAADVEAARNADITEGLHPLAMLGWESPEAAADLTALWGTLPAWLQDLCLRERRESGSRRYPHFVNVVRSLVKNRLNRSQIHALAEALPVCRFGEKFTPRSEDQSRADLHKEVEKAIVKFLEELTETDAKKGLATAWLPAMDPVQPDQIQDANIDANSAALQAAVAFVYRVVGDDLEPVAGHSSSTGPQLAQGVAQAGSVLAAPIEVPHSSPSLNASEALEWMRGILGRLEDPKVKGAAEQAACDNIDKLAFAQQADPALYTKVLSRLSSEGKRLVRAGVKDFAKKNKAKLASNRQQQSRTKLVTEGNSSNQWPFGEESVGEIIEKTSGIHMERYGDDSDGPVLIRITSFVARITRDIVLDDGMEMRRQFGIQSYCRGEYRDFSIAANKFGDLGWVPTELGPKAFVVAGAQAKDKAREAIQRLSSAVEIPRVHTYTHLGWRDIQGIGKGYLHAGGAITAEGLQSDVVTEFSRLGSLQQARLPAPMAGPDRADVVRRGIDHLLYVGPLTVTAPLFAAIWRATFGQVDFSLWLSGLTGSYKSELAALVQQHWGAGFIRENLPGNWSSSENALEGQAFTMKDASFVIDDFALEGKSQNEQSRLFAKAERLLRAQGNHSGRDTMTVNRDIRSSKPPRGLIIATGEALPRGHSILCSATIWMTGQRQSR
jgi:hypothetical protein